MLVGSYSLDLYPCNIHYIYKFEDANKVCGYIRCNCLGCYVLGVPNVSWVHTGVQYVYGMILVYEVYNV